MGNGAEKQILKLALRRKDAPGLFFIARSTEEIEQTIKCVTTYEAYRYDSNNLLLIRISDSEIDQGYLDARMKSVALMRVDVESYSEIREMETTLLPMVLVFASEDDMARYSKAYPDQTRDIILLNALL